MDEWLELSCTSVPCHSAWRGVVSAPRSLCFIVCGHRPAPPHRVERPPSSARQVAWRAVAPRGPPAARVVPRSSPGLLFAPGECSPLQGGPSYHHAARHNSLLIVAVWGAEREQHSMVWSCRGSHFPPDCPNEHADDRYSLRCVTTQCCVVVLQ